MIFLWTEQFVCQNWYLIGLFRIWVSRENLKYAILPLRRSEISDMTPWLIFATGYPNLTHVSASSSAMLYQNIEIWTFCYYFSKGDVVVCMYFLIRNDLKTLTNFDKILFVCFEIWKSMIFATIFKEIWQGLVHICAIFCSLYICIHFQTVVKFFKNFDIVKIQNCSFPAACINISEGISWKENFCKISRKGNSIKNFM